MIERAKLWARALKRDIAALYIAARDPRTPWHAKAAALAVAAYALSPIDLIPDFIPVLGSLDDLIIVPLGILLAVWLIPAELMEEFRRAALERGKPLASWRAAAVVAALWCLALAAAGWWAYNSYRRTR
jgi:uncharacterized membrane protein YkvA (DUF1232 family)